MLGILVVVAVLGFIIGTRFERAHGGPLTAGQLTGETAEKIGEIEIVSVQVR